MKNTQTFLTFLFIILGSATYAQQGDSYINLQAGIGGSIQANDVKMPSFYASYEYFVGDNISIGVLGGYAPLSINTQELIPGQGFIEAKEENSNIIASALLNYYLSSGDTFELYLGGSAGYASGLTASFLYEMHAGARYMLSDNFGLNSEVGFGVSLLRIGVSFKL